MISTVRLPSGWRSSRDRRKCMMRMRGARGWVAWSADYYIALTTTSLTTTTATEWLPRLAYLVLDCVWSVDASNSNRSPPSLPWVHHAAESHKCFHDSQSDFPKVQARTSLLAPKTSFIVIVLSAINLCHALLNDQWIASRTLSMKSWAHILASEQISLRVFNTPSDTKLYQGPEQLGELDRSRTRTRN